MRKVIALLAVVGLMLMSPYVSAQEITTEDVYGWLYVPRLEKVESLTEALIVDGIYQIPDYGAVHLWGTAWIDTTYGDLIRAGGGIAPEGSEYPAGRIGLSGHRSGVFSWLPEVVIGDVIYLADWPDLVEFEVVSVDVVDFDPDLLAPTIEDQRLSLITCDGEQYLVIEAIRTDT